jgi:hypothetical protein
LLNFPKVATNPPPLGRFTTNSHKKPPIYHKLL